MSIGAPQFTVVVGNAEHTRYAEEISRMIAEASKEPGVALARRSPEYLADKLASGKSVLCFDCADNGRAENIVGFCYIETWGEGNYVANSGLTVKKEYRKYGIGKLLKEKAFELSRQKYPNAKLFGLTTNPAVMKINSKLGYRPTSYSSLTTDDQFWAGCQTCPHFEILQRLKREVCLCTAMIFDPAEESNDK